MRACVKKGYIYVTSMTNEYFSILPLIANKNAPHAAGSYTSVHTMMTFREADGGVSSSVLSGLTNDG